MYQSYLNRWRSICCACAAPVMVLASTVLLGILGSATLAQDNSPPLPAPVEVSPSDELTVPGDPMQEMQDDLTLYVEQPEGPGGPQPWTLPQPCFMQNMGVKIGGWIDQGITANGNDPTSRYNGPVALNDRSGDWQVNQMWLYLDKQASNEGCGFAMGGHVDVMYGTDWRYGSFYGLELNINDPDQLYGLVLPQFYLDFAYNKLKVRVGHMAGPLGYEVVPSPLNFFYSHSYAMSYTEPQLVTGVRADYQFNDNWSGFIGFHRGWFMYEDMNNKLDAMGGINWANCDKTSQIRFAFSTGDQQTAIRPMGRNWFAYSLVYERKFSERFEYVMQHNGGLRQDLVPTGNASYNGINQYLYYTINSKVKAGLRVEWLQDNDGGAVNGVGNWLGNNRGYQGVGYAGNFWAVTAGLNWRPCANLVVRPELRYDWYAGRDSFVNGSRPFGNGDRDDQFLAAVDLILVF